MCLLRVVTAVLLALGMQIGSSQGGEPLKLIVQMDCDEIGSNMPARGTLLVVNSGAESAQVPLQCADDAIFEVVNQAGASKRLKALETEIEGGKSRTLQPGEAYRFGFVLLRDQEKPPQFVFARRGEYKLSASMGLGGGKSTISEPVAIQVNANSEKELNVLHWLAKPEISRVFLEGARNDEHIQHLHWMLTPEEKTPLNDECHLAMARFFGRKATGSHERHPLDDVWAQTSVKEWAEGRALAHYQAMSAESASSEARRTYELAALLTKYGWLQRKLPEGIEYQELLGRLQTCRSDADQIAFESFGIGANVDRIIVYFSRFQVADLDDQALDIEVPFRFDHAPSLSEVVLQFKVAASVQLDFPPELLGFSKYNTLQNGSICARDFMRGFVGSNESNPRIWRRKNAAESRYSLQSFDPRQSIAN